MHACVQKVQHASIPTRVLGGSVLPQRAQNRDDQFRGGEPGQGHSLSGPQFPQVLKEDVVDRIKRFFNILRYKGVK